MNHKSGWKAFLGPLFLLLLSYFIYFVRFPLWNSLLYIEWISLMLILSYSIVFIVTIFLIRIDLKRSLQNVFSIGKFKFVLLGLVFAVLFQVIYYPINLILGSTIELIPSLTVRGFESYAFFSLSTAFVMYLVFSVFGAFTEEVAYRGYVQEGISSKFGNTLGILISVILFSLQHIHVFQFDWIVRFLQSQFIYVVTFGFFVGYLYMKSKSEIWSVISFHCLMNIFNVSLPLQITNNSYLLSTIATLTSFGLLFILTKVFVKEP